MPRDSHTVTEPCAAPLRGTAPAAAGPAPPRIPRSAPLPSDASGDEARAVRLRQERFYTDAEAQRYAWLTSNPLIRDLEDRLLCTVADAIPADASLLEVGCGEGANLVALRRLGWRGRYTGFDCFHPKADFVHRHHPDAWLALADARRTFPFHSACFDAVLIRDVLHHLAAPERPHVLHEARRVVRPGGSIIIVEGNASNWINLLFACLFPHERGMLQTRAARLTTLLLETFPHERPTVRMAEPCPLFRVITHYHLGMPALGRSPLVRRLAERIGTMTRRLQPAQTWAYTVAVIRTTAAT